MSGFPFPIVKDDFTVNFTLTQLGAGVSPYYTHSQNTNIRRVNIVKAYNANRTLETIFGGAYSGTYSVQIRHKTFGLIDTSALTFTVGSEVASFTPNVGSIYGG